MIRVRANYFACSRWQAWTITLLHYVFKGGISLPRANQNSNFVNSTNHPLYLYLRLLSRMWWLKKKLRAVATNGKDTKDFYSHFWFGMHERKKSLNSVNFHRHWTNLVSFTSKYFCYLSTTKKFSTIAARHIFCMNEKLTMRPSIEVLSLKSNITNEGVNGIFCLCSFGRVLFPRIFLIFHVLL